MLFCYAVVLCRAMVCWVICCLGPTCAMYTRVCTQWPHTGASALRIGFGACYATVLCDKAIWGRLLRIIATSILFGKAGRQLSAAGDADRGREFR